MNGYPQLLDHDTCVRHVVDFMNAFYKETNLYPVLYEDLCRNCRLSPSIKPVLIRKGALDRLVLYKIQSTKDRRLASLANLAI